MYAGSAFGMEEADARRFRGMNPAFVRKVWAKRRAARPAVERDPRFWNAERIAEVAQMLRDGASYRQIARVYNRSDKTIGRLIWERPELSAVRAECARKPKAVAINDNWTLAVPKWVNAELRAVARSHNVTAREIVGDIRTKRIVAARNELFYRLRMNKREPAWGQLGRWFGRDHTAIMYAASVYASAHNLPIRGGLSVEERKARALMRRSANA